jgi:GTPase Era involved in 16S rRNA processing
LNTQISHPEIVILGPASHGKSALLEAIIGRQFNVVGLGGVTRRPLYLNIVNNLDCAEPRITLKRDSLLHGQGFDRDMPVSLEALPAELAKRFSKEGKEPVFVQYEHKASTNMTFIDTPGIPDEDAAEYDAAVEATIAIAKPTNRLLLCVEEANDWTKIRMIKILKQVDPDLSRTIFAYTKFHSQLSLFNSLAAVNRFLGGIVPDTKTFFVSLPSTKVRQKQTNAESYQEKVWQAYRRDMNNLETLQYDKRYERNIGIHALRKYLLNRIWKSYQEGVPEILKCLRSRKLQTQRSLQLLTSQSSTLDALKLRQIANNYCVEFLQTIDRLIAGTSEGTPTVSGQTLEEEKSAQGDVEWLDVYNHTITFDAEKWGVPFWNSHIYGGQQFERLLAEFKAVCDHTEISEVSLDDVATAAGINKVNNVPNYAWAAADLAQHQTQDAFLPLIEQLQRRAVYVIKRLHDIAEKIMAAKKKKSNSAASSSGAGAVDHIDIEDIGLYPYFTNQVKDLFYKFIDNAAKNCRERCLDEFYSSKTIFWELTEFSDRKLPTDRTDKNPEEAKAAVSKLAADLFKSIRERITKNVLLKFYNFFLVPMQTDLWNEVQRKITTVSDEQLDQFFQVKTTKDKLKEDEKSLESLLSRTTEQETQFLDIARQFTHPTNAPSETDGSSVGSKPSVAGKFGAGKK